MTLICLLFLGCWLPMTVGLVESQAMDNLFHLPLTGQPEWVIPAGASHGHISAVVASDQLIAGISEQGEIDWRKEVGSKVTFLYTPTEKHDSVFSIDKSGHLRRWSKSTGALKFSTKLSSSSTSPLQNIQSGEPIVANTVELLTADDRFLYAVHSNTGKLLWQKAVPAGGSWLVMGSNELVRLAGDRPTRATLSRAGKWDTKPLSLPAASSSSFTALCADGHLVQLDGATGTVSSGARSVATQPGAVMPKHCQSIRRLAVLNADRTAVAMVDLHSDGAAPAFAALPSLLDNEQLAECWPSSSSSSSSSRAEASSVFCLTSIGDFVTKRWRRLESLTGPVIGSYLIEQAISSHENPFGFNQLLVVPTARSLTALDANSGRLVYQLVFAGPEAVATHRLSDHLLAILSAGEQTTPVRVVDALTGQTLRQFAVRLQGALKFSSTVAGEPLTRDDRHPVIDDVLLMDDADRVHVVTEQGLQSNVSAARFAGSVLQLKSEDTGIQGYQLMVDRDESAVRATALWQFQPANAGERIIQFAQSHPTLEAVSSPAEIYPDGRAQLKFLQRNLVAVATLTESATATDSKTASQLRVYLLDGGDGCLVDVVSHVGAYGPVTLSLIENKLVYTYWNERTRRPTVSVIDLFFPEIDWTGRRGRQGQCVVHGGAESSQPVRRQASFTAPHTVLAATPTYSQRGITRRAMVFALASNQLLEVSARLLDSGRPKPRAPATDAADRSPDDDPFAYNPGALAYQPDLPLAHLHLFSRNFTVQGVRSFVAGVTELESTGVLCALGRDIYCSHIRPSGSFDILSAPSKTSLSLMIGILLVATIITHRMTSKLDLKQKWA